MMLEIHLELLIQRPLPATVKKTYVDKSNSFYQLGRPGWTHLGSALVFRRIFFACRSIFSLYMPAILSWGQARKSCPSQETAQFRRLQINCLNANWYTKLKISGRIQS
jgi:hypothetical protein